MANIKTKRERIKFASDNVAGACPEVLNAVIEANDGDSTPYGNDQISTELQDKFSEIFEKEVIVFPTASGTAANALALSTMTPSFGNIYCHKLSHINTDECGASATDCAVTHLTARQSIYLSRRGTRFAASRHPV